MYCSFEREANLVSAELSSFKSVEKDWQSQLVINFIDQVSVTDSCAIYRRVGLFAKLLIYLEEIFVVLIFTPSPHRDHTHVDRLLHSLHVVV